MPCKTEMWRFETAQFVIRATMEPDDDYDSSCDDAETLEAIDDGRYLVFGTVVTVEWKPNRAVLGRDSLWGSVYENPRDFFVSHRDKDPMNRNCSLFRAANGENHVICHYFPDLVRTAIAEARKTLAAMPRVRKAS